MKHPLCPSYLNFFQSFLGLCDLSLWKFSGTLERTHPFGLVSLHLMVYVLYLVYEMCESETRKGKAMQAIEEKPKEDTRPDTMTTMEMGKRLRVDGHTIVRWINQGLMPGGRVGDTYRTDRETFEKWYAERFTGGNVEENPRRTQTEE